MTITVGYLVNQYPKVSHSFIRREIQCLESMGLKIHRFSIRSCESELVDEQDRVELDKTRIILKAGLLNVLVSLLFVVVTKATRLVSAMQLLLQLSSHSDRSVLYHLAYFAEACVLLRWCKENQISHVHAHFGTNSTTVALLSHRLGGPTYSFTVHGPEEFDKVYLLSLKQKIESAAFVVAISDFGRSQLYRWCNHTHWKKINVVRCGLDDQFLDCEPSPIQAKPHLVCIGRLCEQKGQILLVEACHQLAKRGRDFKLTLVGDGEERSTVENLIENYGLSNQIEITGWATAEQVKQQIQASRVMVLPSFAEGLPVVIMEALALHRPVISTYVAGIPELVTPEKCGWLIPSGSIDALTLAIESALDTPVEELTIMGQAGAEAVATYHCATIEASKLAELFRMQIQKSAASIRVNHQASAQLQ